MDEPFGVAGLEAFWTLDLEPTAESEPAMLPTERTVPAERSGRARTWVRFHADGELHGVDVRGREVESWRMRWHLEGDAQDRVVLSALEGEGSPYAGSVLCRRAPNLLESCGEQRNLVLRRLPADPRRPSVIPYPRRLSGALIGAQSQAILSCYRSVLGSCRDDAAAAGSADSADSADPAAPARPAGRIVMDLRVRTDASVEISIREDTLGSEGVVDCIRDILLGIDFPRPVGADLSLDAPLVFDVAPSPEGGDGNDDAAASLDD
ncbi:MAG: hypothetical protein EA398_15765 [Deltaproteobacteria bacterium]|nr:MAG: hypothetical protein EA398_15765 [Deltaproteobacteria bacterium]